MRTMKKNISLNLDDGMINRKYLMKDEEIKREREGGGGRRFRALSKGWREEEKEGETGRKTCKRAGSRQIKRERDRKRKRINKEVDGIEELN